MHGSRSPARMNAFAFSPQAEAVIARIDAELATLDVDANETHPPERDHAFANAFHIADANLRHFLPDLDGAGCRRLIREILFHQRMSTLDQNDFDLLRVTGVDSRCGDLPWSNGTPRIFCTYHLGSYKFLFHALAARGVDCMLFVSGRTLMKQGESFLQAAQRARETRGWTGRLEIVDAENRNSVLVGMRALRRGKALVLYADGNAGTGEGDERLRPVSFFGRTLAVRSGIAYLSHAGGAPVVPTTCRRRADGSLDLVFHEAIAPDGCERTAYIDATLQTIHDRLASILRTSPGQWEGWLYAHRALAGTAFDGGAGAPLAMAEAMQRALDRERYALLRFPGLRLLLDKRAFTCTVIEAAG